LHRRTAILPRFYKKVYNHNSVSDEVIGDEIMEIKAKRRAKVG
jgi:hypothetical protein